MKNKLTTFILTVCLVFSIVQIGAVSADDNLTVTSPNGCISISIETKDGKINYSVKYNSISIIESSNIGITFSSVDFSEGVKYVSSYKNTVDETYSMLTGKASVYTNKANETVMTFEKDGHLLDLYVRAYDDGIAFRYGFNENGQALSENTTFRLPQNCTVNAMEYEMCYENFYNRHNLYELNGVYGMPMTVKVADNTYALITEAELNGNYAGSVLNADGSNVLKLGYEPKQSEPVEISAPFLSPWRTVIIGDLNTIVSTEMPENLCAPSKLEDTSWIKPGVSSWTWFNGDPTNDPEVYKQYIDLSGDMGWQYVLLDEGWQPLEYDEYGRKTYSGIMDWTEEVIEYGKQRGIGIIVWSTSWDLDTEQKRERLKEWANMGIKGIKVDFFNSETQQTLKLMDSITQESAELKLLVNFHGCVKPTGERRTWPNLITREAVYGNEHFLSGENWGPTAEHNCTLPFTRNAVGPMDFTPELTNHNDKNYFTDGQKCALPIVFESGIQCLSDKPQIYENSAARELFKSIPAVWDETKLLSGDIGESAAVMRRFGDTYYVGSICNNQYVVDINLDFLKSGKYWFEMYTDGSNDTDIAVYNGVVTNRDTITIPQLTHGGGAVKFTPIKENTKLFSDIDGHWCEKNILSLAEKNKLNKYFYGEFGVDEYITRAEFVMLLTDALDIGCMQGSPRFYDSIRHIAKNYIYTATEKGIINGTSEETFLSESNITREDAATIIGRYENLKGGINSGFSDSNEISQYAKEYVAQCVAMGVITGYEDNSFKPKNNITKAEAAAMLFRCQNLK